MDIQVLKGQTLAAIIGMDAGSEEIIFEIMDGTKYRMFHSQDCCETVQVAEVIGDVTDLLAGPILEAEVSTNRDNKPEEYSESWTWTFYKLGTIRGHVTIRWLGESNGYYSEDVDFEKVGDA